MGAPPSEDQLADMLSNPNVAQLMNEALNNPATVDMMIQSNPMLRDNPRAREIIQSPLFRSMLTNPDTLRSFAQMRRSMGGGGGAEAFPAPGATDTTPAGAPAAGAQAGNNAQFPPAGFPLWGGAFGAPPAGLGGGAGDAANPFMALLNPLGAPPAGQAAAGQAPGGGNTAQRDATATSGVNPTSPPAGGDNAAAANPFGSLFGGLPGAQANPFGVTPEQMQQFMQMMGGGGMGGFGAPPAPADNRPPEERYADQLRQLNEMGFFDFDQNVAALRRSGGNVQGAVNFLLGG